MMPKASGSDQTLSSDHTLSSDQTLGKGLIRSKVFEYESPENIRTDFLETFEFDSPTQYIKTETHEFVAACPFSGLPDVGRLIIEYHPEGGCCIELKSLKYYVVSFRDVGLFQEGVTRRIYDDLSSVLKTSRIRVTTIYNTRGGFDTTCVEGSL